MRSGSFFPDLLTEFQFRQFANNRFAKDQSDQERRDRRPCRPESDVLKNVQALEQIRIRRPRSVLSKYQLIKEVIKHCVLSSALKAAADRSALSGAVVAASADEVVPHRGGTQSAFSSSSNSFN